MSKIVDFDDDLNNEKQRLEKALEQSEKIKDGLASQDEELNVLLDEVNGLSGSRVSFQDSKKTSSNISWEDTLFLNRNPVLLESRIKKEIEKNPRLLPKFSGVDMAVTVLAGAIASVVDALVVKIPKDITSASSIYNGQKGSKVTSSLRKLGVDKDGKLSPFLKSLENNCKVPYDQSINPKIPGFHPKTHRLMSLGHDPLFGLVFGVLDIIMGRMTVIDSNGTLHIVKTFTPASKDMVFAPFIQIGHIVSDLCTKMGIPIPGWGFTQLLQFGSIGPKNRTIADISRWMYLNGYDLRHMVTMSIPTAIIEIIVRAYHYLSSLKSKKMIQNSIFHSIASKELARVESNLKLHKMLFFSHMIAASGNGIKIFAYGGNPLAFNVVQWGTFLKKSATMYQALTRNKTSEMITRNRKHIDKKWQEIKSIELGGLGSSLGTTGQYSSLLE